MIKLHERKDTGTRKHRNVSFVLFEGVINNSFAYAENSC